ncbi:MAG: ATP-binding protein [Rhodocyclaceae bacterium]|nr:ATP-binding protein [Rhodocyclaceae bacterium]
MPRHAADDDSLRPIVARLDALLDLLAPALRAPAPDVPDWENAIAFFWCPAPEASNLYGRRSHLRAIRTPHRIRLQDLIDIDEQKARMVQNTRQFVAGRPANNVLLTGARGTGKSSLVKAVLNEFAADGLRLIELDRDGLLDLPELIDLLAARPERFILYCDDLSFETHETGYKALKSVLDGSLAALPENILIYATSNRRHLLPEYFDDNRDAAHVDGELHPGEAVEEKISLSERFGLWISFYPFSQDEYLAIAAHWLRTFGLKEREIDAARGEALQWALMRGARSGRIAWQFARDYAGRHAQAKAGKGGKAAGRRK